MEPISLSPVNTKKSNASLSPVLKNHQDGFNNTSTLNGNSKNAVNPVSNGLLGTNPLGPPVDRSLQVLLDKKDQTILELNDHVAVSNHSFCIESKNLNFTNEELGASFDENGADYQN